MNNLQAEDILLTRPDQRILKSKADELVINKITVTNLVATNLNGTPISGTLVSTTAVQTLSNKSLVDTSTFIVDNTDSTIKTGFDASGGANTTAIIKTSIPIATTTRTFTFADTGSDADVVLTEGNQTINGAKTFTAITITGGAMDDITKITSAGTRVNTIQMDHVTAAGQPFDMIRSNSTETDISIGLIPKGLGFISVRLPDNASTGGNTRGASAIDLQLTRNAATQVASGARSIVMGSNSTASAADSIAIGARAVASNAGSLVISDTTASDITSTSTNQMTTRFTNGYRMLGSPMNFNDVSVLSTSGTATTVGAVVASAVTATLTDNAMSLAIIELIGTSAAGQSVYIKYSTKINTVGGIATIGTAFDSWIVSDFAGVSAATSATGLSLSIDITGSAGNTINWRATCRILQTVF
jgi:hypothetical protein